ncbi:hypothetical protein STAFG_3955 [Streptomyces afghaniensis 772]|uniref:Uncharacterized protein n=1 Tax=Streptomyces afghaniensis 772 TaxID=1283301 RepID=S4MTP5_9ACTN|nr:hypothetical protein STAFG_3955 [Streptomyces afghaniensis 772]
MDVSYWGVPAGGVKPALGIEVTVAWSCTDGDPDGDCGV